MSCVHFVSFAFICSEIHKILKIMFALTVIYDRSCSMKIVEKKKKKKKKKKNNNLTPNCTVIIVVAAS